MAYGNLTKKPNIVILISDQQSGHPHWPEHWEKENLPALRWLKEHGLSFDRGYTNSCTCSPSRATFFTGLYPAQHGVIEVLEFDNMQDLFSRKAQQTAVAVKERRQRGLASQLQNLAKILKTAGYNVVLKGKWHLAKPAQFSTSLNQKYWTPADVQHLAERWGFEQWGMPDAGDNLALANMGGGNINNDGRFVDGVGQAAKYGTTLPQDQLVRESALHFLTTYDSDQPFCLIVSLVNPHDVLAFPGTATSYVTQCVDGKSVQVPLYQAAGYTNSMFENLPIEVPKTWNERLTTKPKAQAAFRVLSQANGPIGPQDQDLARQYCQFYAYLCAEVDKEHMKIITKLQETNRLDDTVIVRISDHGDMAMAHGRQRQKMFNIYEETLNVPFIISNPQLFPEPQATQALAGLIDWLPTLATIAEVPDRDRWEFKGRDLTPVIFDAKSTVQDFVHFTYDDLYFFVPGASHIRCLVEEEWKYAVYYDMYSGAQPEYEMYARSDKDEVANLGNPTVLNKLKPAERERVLAERERLHQRLIRVMNDLGTMPDTIIWPPTSGPSPFASTDLPPVQDEPPCGEE